jgi:class 3 adenylate cyclase
VERPGKSYLKQLLSDRNQFPDRVDEIDETIRRTFERRVAVLVLDMSGFSRLTIQYGIVHYLAMIVQMEVASRPAVLENHGQVIKVEADNLFAVFDNPDDAVEGALDILRAFQAVNSVVPENRDLHGCIGIGYGDTLVLDEEDMFGCELNLASKLGEDLAEPGEILITAAAREAMTGNRHRFAKKSYRVSGVDIECYRYLGRATGFLPDLPEIP